jgi:hypothetical protein
VPPKPIGADGKPVANSTLTDCSVAWQTEDDAKGGKYRMFYTTFDGTGYRTGLATSHDLVNWDFSAGIIFDRNPTPGTFDYGGVTFGCPLYENASVTAPRKLQKKNGKFYVLYGSYPNRGHYESGHGAEGVAWSADDTGLGWNRESLTIPILSVDGASAWEKDVIYQPNLVVGKDGTNRNLLHLTSRTSYSSYTLIHYTSYSYTSFFFPAILLLLLLLLLLLQVSCTTFTTPTAPTQQELVSIHSS